MSSRILVDEIYSKTGNTSALTIDSSGRVQMPVVPAWRVGLTGNQTNTTAGSDVQIVYNDSNTNNCFLQGGVTLSSGIITVPIAGVYHVNMSARIDFVGSGYIIAKIKRNNIDSDNSDTYIIAGSPSSNYENLTGSDVFKCDANDNFRVTVYSDSDTSWNMNSNTLFSGHLVG